MASFRVMYGDGSVAKNTKVSIFVDGGGVSSGITDSRGYITISTSKTFGKIIINKKTVHQGSLNIGEIVV